MTLGEIMDVNDRTEQWGTLGIWGEGPPEVAKGIKCWWKGAFQDTCGVGSAQFSGRG